jgi:hypothetical protein
MFYIGREVRTLHLGPTDLPSLEFSSSSLVGAEANRQQSFLLEVVLPNAIGSSISASLEIL